ncbi:MAG: hypothetical protein LAO79_29455 [Acidobacteriia bacterium]|nr:hypothetical protein [Terriglobia bacterium]
MLMAGASAFPVARSFAYFNINFNEGWNAHRHAAAEAGQPLYGAPPKYTVTNYPPLSFHLIVLAGSRRGRPEFMPRCCSFYGSRRFLRTGSA